MNRLGNLIFLLIALMLAAGAAAQTNATVDYETITETGEASSISYPSLTAGADANVLAAINAALYADAEIDAWLAVMRGVRPDGGWGITVTSDTFARSGMVSVRIDCLGKMKNGRWGQVTTGLVYSLVTGARVTADTLFADVEAARNALAEYANAALSDELSTYMDSRELEPFPIENFSLTEEGMVFHYAAKQVCYLSGWAGGLYVPASVLNPLLIAPIEPQGAETLLERASLGELPGIPVRVGDLMPNALATLRPLHDPDGFLGGQCFAFEEARARGVIAVAADETSPVTRIDASSFEGCGLISGSTLQDDWRALLGQPHESGLVDAERAARERLPEGPYDTYHAGGYTLTLYADALFTLRVISLEGETL